MAYVLTNFESANVIGAYKTEQEALEVVVDAVERYGADSRVVLALNLGEGSRHIAHGRVLVNRALASRQRKTA